MRIPAAQPAYPPERWWLTNKFVHTSEKCAYPRNVLLLGAVRHIINIPSVDKDTHGFDGQKERPYILKGLANTQSIPCGLFVVWPLFCHGKTALHLTAMDFRVIFGF